MEARTGTRGPHMYTLNRYSRKGCGVKDKTIEKIALYWMETHTPQGNCTCTIVKTAIFGPLQNAIETISSEGWPHCARTEKKQLPHGIAKSWGHSVSTAVVSSLLPPVNLLFSLARDS